MGLILHPSLRFSVLCCLLRIPGIRLVKLMRRMMVAGDDSATKESFVVKKSLFSRSKHSLGRAIHQMGGFSNRDSNYTDEGGVEMKRIVKEPLAVAVSGVGDHLPQISEPSMLVSEGVRNAVYASLPALIRGRKWFMLYRYICLSMKMKIHLLIQYCVVLCISLKLLLINVCLTFLCFMQHLETWYITFNSLPAKHALSWNELAGKVSLTF